MAATIPSGSDPSDIVNAMHSSIDDNDAHVDMDAVVVDVPVATVISSP